MEMKKLTFEMLNDELVQCHEDFSFLNLFFRKIAMLH